MARELEGGVMCCFCGCDMELTESFWERRGMESRITLQCKTHTAKSLICSIEAAKMKGLCKKVCYKGLVLFVC